MDAALAKYKDFPRSTQGAWRRLQSHRQSLPSWWTEQLRIPSEFGPLYKATSALEYLGLLQEKEELECRLQQLIRETEASVSSALEMSDPALMERLLRSTRGFEFLLSDRLARMHAQYTAMVAQAQIDISELLNSAEPSSLPDIDDALAGYGGNQMDALSDNLAALRSHRERILHDARIALRRALSEGRYREDDEASRALQSIHAALTRYRPASREPEWVALSDEYDRLIIKGRERLTELTKSNDLVLIAHAVRDYKGGHPAPLVFCCWECWELTTAICGRFTTARGSMGAQLATRPHPGARCPR